MKLRLLLFRYRWQHFGWMPRAVVIFLPVLLVAMSVPMPVIGVRVVLVVATLYACFVLFRFGPYMRVMNDLHKTELDLIVLKHVVEGKK